MSSDKPESKGIVLEIDTCEHSTHSEQVQLESFELIQVNTVTGSVSTTTTTLPPELMHRSKDERSSTMTHTLVEKDGSLKGFEQYLRPTVNPVLSGELSINLSKFNDRILIFQNCNFHNSFIGNVIETVDITTVNEGDEIKQAYSMETLRSELERIIPNRLSKQDYEGISEISGALESLKKDDCSGMLQHLKNTASWIYDEAKDIGSKVLAEIVAKYILKTM